MVEKLTNSEIQKSMDTRLETIGVQKTIFGENINITQFKNLKEKRELKEKVLKMFKGEMIRSILTPKELDGNKRLDSIERQKQSGDRDSNANVIERADSFGKKTLNTLSVFPSLLTTSYTTLLSKEGDIVLDLFSGHNSRASNVLAMGRKYVGFDVHSFPLEMCQKGCAIYPEENYALYKQSSEDLPFADETFDFAITCPPYWEAEKYSEIYGEEVSGDLSGKDYETFLQLYNNCFNEAFRTLKKGSFCVVVIGDVHKGGRLYPLHLDTIDICLKAGFRLHDINIYNRKSNIGGDLNYKTFILTCKRFPCIHEYCLIFQKP